MMIAVNSDDGNDDQFFLFSMYTKKPPMEKRGARKKEPLSMALALPCSIYTKSVPVWAREKVDFVFSLV